MSQNLLVLPTTGTVSGTELVTLVNQALDTLNTVWSGASAPSEPEAYQLWQDTSTAPPTLRQYDGAQWVALGVIDTTNHLWLPPLGGGSGTIASANSCNLGAAPQSFLQITGTTQIDDFGASMKPGQVKIVEFAAALTLQNNANVILPTGANIVTAAGDMALVTCTAAGTPNVCRVVYLPASGQALSAPSSSAGTNFVIDGGVEVCQPGNSYSLGTSAAWNAAGPDVLMAWATGTAVSAGTVSQDTSASVGRTGKALKVGGATITGSGVVYARTRIPSKNACKLINVNASLGVSVYQDTGASVTYTWILRKANATDNFGGGTTQIATGTQSVTSGTASQIAALNQAMGSCGNGIEIEIQAACGAVTTKDFWCTEWMLVEGATLPSIYPRQKFSEILDQVKSWRQRSYAYGTANATATRAGLMKGSQQGAWVGRVDFLGGEMYTAPTISYWDGAGAASKTSYTSGYTSLSWTDGQTPYIPPTDIGPNGFIWTGATGAGSTTDFIHYDADGRLT